ncbi:allene oxide cyclase barrel-like domain-containing protein [Streptomyces sp. NBC_01508]|uniref:allene oxide cyclase barrel-like domain-containing protein n=1 Tax=Streptomyces sp. NBC_01508 TaxID=2903888 RepID=UPI0038647087
MEMTAAEYISIDERALEVGTESLREAPDPGPLNIRALAVAAATEAGQHTPGVDSEDDAVAKCLVRSLTEMAEKLTVSHPPEEAGPGTTVEYVEAFVDEDGERVGTMTGNSVVLTMTPHMWQFHRGTTEFEDGPLEHSAMPDCTALMRSMTQIHRVKGTSGVYLGKSGYMAFEISDPTQTPPHFSSTFVVC